MRTTFEVPFRQVKQVAMQLGESLDNITNSLKDKWGIDTAREIQIQFAADNLLEKIHSVPILPDFTHSVITETMIGDLTEALKAVDQCIKLPVVDKQIEIIAKPFQAMLMRFHKATIVIQSLLDRDYQGRPDNGSSIKPSKENIRIMSDAINFLKSLTRLIITSLVNEGKVRDDELLSGHYKLLKTLVRFSTKLNGKMSNVSAWQGFGFTDDPAHSMREWGIPEKIVQAGLPRK